MGEELSGGLRTQAFWLWATGIVGVALLQSTVHLLVVLARHDYHSVLDLDRSNGVPDLVSTVALGCAATGAAAVARWSPVARRVVPTCLAAVLCALTIADLLHDGAHPATDVGRFVIGLVTAAAVLLGAVAVGSAARARATLALAALLLAGSFFVSGLDHLDVWFERMRGDAVVEVQIVAKEGLELVGWSLVALALWDEALRRRLTPRAHGMPALSPSEGAPPA
jgi:hypothetical protein